VVTRERFASWKYVTSIRWLSLVAAMVFKNLPAGT
jgi:hypothetical protein